MTESQVKILQSLEAEVRRVRAEKLAERQAREETALYEYGAELLTRAIAVWASGDAGIALARATLARRGWLGSRSAEALKRVLDPVAQNVSTSALDAARTAEEWVLQAMDEEGGTR